MQLRATIPSRVFAQCIWQPRTRKKNGVALLHQRNKDREVQSQHVHVQYRSDISVVPVGGGGSVTPRNLRVLIRSTVGLVEAERRGEVGIIRAEAFG